MAKDERGNVGFFHYQIPYRDVFTPQHVDCMLMRTISWHYGRFQVPQRIPGNQLACPRNFSLKSMYNRDGTTRSFKNHPFAKYCKLLARCVCSLQRVIKSNNPSKDKPERVELPNKTTQLETGGYS